MPRYDLEGQVAIVTGAGRGIGRAISLRLASEGVSVAVTDIDSSNADNVVAEIESDGGQAVALQVDVTRKENVDQMVQDTISKFGCWRSINEEWVTLTKCAFFVFLW